MSNLYIYTLCNYYKLVLACHPKLVKIIFCPSMCRVTNCQSYTKVGVIGGCVGSCFVVSHMNGSRPTEVVNLCPYEVIMGGQMALLGTSIFAYPERFTTLSNTDVLKRLSSNKTIYKQVTYLFV